jgi:hypothetical protein
MSPRQTTREHALAQWILGALPGEGPVTHMRQSTARGPVDQVWTSDELQIIAKQVCEDCNTVWMSRLEGRAKPRLTPMIQGHGGKLLLPESQEVIAAWAVKTALALHLTTPEQGAPQAHYHEIARTHRPPANARVWLAAYEDWRAAYHHSSLLKLTTDRLSGDGYVTTLTVGRLCLQVVGWVGVEESVTWESEAWARAVLSIFPPTDPVVWPPPLILDDPAMLAFSMRYETP